MTLVQNDQPDESLRPALEALAERDRDIARAFASCGLPKQRSQEPGFAGLMRIIVAQQLSIHAARSILDRLSDGCGAFDPVRIAAMDDEALRSCGLSRPKVRYIKALAEDVASGRLDLDGLAAMADEDAIAHLTQVKGLGRWSAEIYLLFALKRPDVWPADDLAVRTAAQKLKGWAERPDKATMAAFGDTLRPHRSAAARFLWHVYRHDGLPTP